MNERGSGAETSPLSQTLSASSGHCGIPLNYKTRTTTAKIRWHIEEVQELGEEGGNRRKTLMKIGQRR
jgi:hypothetical protein